MLLELELEPSPLVLLLELEDDEDDEDDEDPPDDPLLVPGSVGSAVVDDESSPPVVVSGTSKPVDVGASVSMKKGLSSMQPPVRQIAINAAQPCSRRVIRTSPSRPRSWVR